MKETIRSFAVSAALTALVVSAAPVASAAGGPPETMEFEPAQVACISGQTGTVADSRVLLAFDLSGLPDSAEIRSARLRLTEQAGIAWDASFVPVLAGELTRAWDASTASWYDASASQAWDSPGGDWDLEHTAYKVIVRKARAPAELLVTDIVARWASGATPNYGVIVMITEVEELADVVPYFNAQYLEPVLRVRYSVPRGTP
jgi:hypothetical protein